MLITPFVNEQRCLRTLHTPLLVLMVACMGLYSTMAWARNSETSAAFTATQLVRQFTLRNTVSQVNQGLQGFVTDHNGTLRGLPMATPASNFPADMGTVPAGYGVPVRDGAGRPLGYCAWDNGTSSAGGGFNAGLGASVPLVYAIVSSGMNGAIETSCAQILATRTASGDDYVEFKQPQQTASQQYRSSVATYADLAGTPGMDGDVRLVRDTNRLYAYQSGSWVPVSSGSPAFNDDSAANGTGAISYTAGKVTMAEFQATMATLSSNLSVGGTGTFDGALTAKNGLTVTTGGATVTGNVSVNGNITSTGAFTATSIAGNGSGLTDLNASNISSGLLGPAFGGTGVNASTAGNGQLLIGNGSGFSLGNLTGTANQVLVSNGPGSIVLSLPQSIDTTSTPTFGGLMLNGALSGVNGSFTGNVSVNRLSLTDPIGLFIGNSTRGSSTGQFLIGIGDFAMGAASNTQSVGVGRLSLYSDSGWYNVALGNNALQQKTSGDGNTALGHYVLNNLTSGSSNVAIGHRTGNTLITGSNNTLVGTGADVTGGTVLSNATALGYGALVGTSNTIVLGRTTDTTVIGATGKASGGILQNKILQVTGDAGVSGNLAIGGTFTASSATYTGDITARRLVLADSTGGVTYPNLVIGSGAMQGAPSGIGANTAVGNLALANSTSSWFNVAVGTQALAAATNGAWNNVAVGVAALASSNGVQNVAVGTNALASATTPGNNTALGYISMNQTTTGDQNTATGSASLYANTTGAGNSAFGYQSLNSNTTGAFNSAVGHYALGGNTTGDRNTAMGSGALGGNTTGQYNSALGRNAGFKTWSDDTTNRNTTGSYNTFLGSYAMPAVNTPISHATAVGSEALVGTSNTIVLGRTTDTTVIGATGTASSGLLQNKILQVTGDVGISGNLAIGGTFTATGFSGNGSGLTNLNANNISSGTLGVARGGTGVDASAAANGQLLIGNGSGFTLANITGTASQVNVTNGAGTITLSLPQSIATTSAPTFGGLTLNGALSGTTGNFTGALTALRLNVADSTGGLTQPNVALGTGTLSGANSGNGGNTAVGYYVLSNNSTGEYNTATGAFSLFQNTTGNYNAAFGGGALQSNTTGNNNTAVGMSSLTSNSTGTDNTAVGLNALRYNTTANGNTAVGSGAMNQNTTGGDNTAMGRYALLSNTTGFENTAVGSDTLTANTTGAYNVALGVSSLSNNVSGGSNAAVGVGSMEKNTTGFFNAALGRDALFGNVSGGSNTAIGYFSLNANSNGSENIAVGRGALSNSASNNQNTALGTWALDGLMNGSNNVAVGTDAGSKGTGSDYLLTSGSNNTFVGDSAGPTFGKYTLNYSTAIGAKAEVGTDNTIVLGRTTDSTVIGATGTASSGILQNKILQVTGDVGISGNLAIGGTFTATAFSGDGSGLSNLNANNISSGILGVARGGTGVNASVAANGQLLIGNGSGFTLANITGTASQVNVTNGAGTITLSLPQSIATTSAPTFGGLTLNGGTTGTTANFSGRVDAASVYVGGSQLLPLTRSNINNAMTFAVDSVTLGDLTFSQLGSGARNTAIGANSLFSLRNGNDNAGLGYQALYTVREGTGNASMGSNALYAVRDGNYNTGIGYQSLGTIRDGSYNTALGANTGTTIDNLTYTTAIGAGTSVSTSNTVVLGRTTDTTVIGATGTATSGILQNKILQVTGDIGASGNIAIGGTFTGNGSGLTNLNAGNFSTGTLSAARGGTGVNGSTAASGQLLIGNGSGFTLANITGTANQITVTNGAGTIALSLPQDIATTSTPTFGGMTLNGALTGTSGTFSGNVTARRLVLSDSTGGVTNPNLVVGMGAMNGTPSGSGGNTAIGIDSLNTNTSGAFNTAIGRASLTKNTTGNSNIAVGGSALFNNATGGSNSAIGANTLFSNTTGNNNIAMGGSALFSNTVGANNSAFGLNTLFSNTSGNNNIAMGGSALFTNTIGANNNAFGLNTLFSNTTGNNNTAMGSGALYNNTTADRNTALGENALYSNTTGTQNLGLGSNAGAALTTGSNNVLVGAYTDVLAGNLSYATALGSGAQVGTSNTVVLGRTTDTTVIGATGKASSGILQNKILQVTGDAGVSGNLTIGGTFNATSAIFSGNVTATRLIVGDSSGGVSVPNIAMGSGNFTTAQSGTGGNTAIGVNVLASNTTGESNVGLGPYALNGNTSGVWNIGIGDSALRSNSTGSYNTVIGVFAGANNTTGSENTAIGADALYANTTGQYNSAVGSLALTANTTGEQNSAFGFQALSNSTTGFYNTAVGAFAMKFNNSGGFNSALGVAALSSNTTGFYNTALGYFALRDSTTSSSNTAVGTSALETNTTGTSNVSMGYQSMRLNTTGNNNVAIGNSVLYNNNANQNTAVGFGSMDANVTGADNAALGAYALRQVNGGSRNVGVGISAGYYLTGGSDNTLLGANAGPSSNSTLNFATAIGASAQVSTSNTIVLGRTTDTTVIGATGSNGSGALLQVTGNASVTRLLLSDGAGVSNPNLVVGTSTTLSAAQTGNGGNTVFGNSAMTSNTSGADNSAFGFRALNSITSGVNNAAFGVNALRSTTTGGYNVGVGSAALNGNTTGSFNTAVGIDALNSNGTGTESVAVGMRSLYSSSGANNVAIGNFALANNTTGQSNVALGRYAGYADDCGCASNANTTGSNNTFLGAYAMPGTTTQLSFATALGSKATVTTSNTVALGRGSDVVVIAKTGDDGSGNKLQVNGSVKATAFNTSSDRRLKTDIAQLGDDILGKMSLLNAYQYRFISDPTLKMRYGVIAQEIAQLFPNAVSYDGLGFMTVDYGALGAIAAAGVGKLNNQMAGLSKTVKEHGVQIAGLDQRVVALDGRVGLLENWRTEATGRMDSMQKAIDVNIEKIAENALKIASNTSRITVLEDALGRIDKRVTGTEGRLDKLEGQWNTHFSASEDGQTLTVKTPNLVVSNFTAEQVRAKAAYTERLEAEMARIRMLEVDNLKAGTALARNVQAETVNTGSTQVYAGAGLPAFLFAAQADGHYTVNTSALDGSYATATVIVNAGQAKVVTIKSEGIELIAEGNTVKAIAAGKTIRASWIKMG